MSVGEDEPQRPVRPRGEALPSSASLGTRWPDSDTGPHTGAHAVSDATLPGAVHSASGSTGSDGSAPDALDWMRQYVNERRESPERIVLDELVESAREAGLGRDDVQRALRTLGIKPRHDGTFRRRSWTAVLESPVVRADPEAVGWTRSFLESREAQRVVVGLDDLVQAAAQVGIDEARVHSSLAAVGVPVKRKRVGHLLSRAEVRAAAASRRVALPVAERVQKRWPNAKVRIIGVDLVEEGPSGDRQPTVVLVRLCSDAPGRLAVRLVVRGEKHAEAEAIAPVLDLNEAGELTLRCEIPTDALGELRHAVDVEAWLDTGGEAYGTIHSTARRFKSRGTGLHGTLAHLTASWLEERS